MERLEEFVEESDDKEGIRKRPDEGQKSSSISAANSLSMAS